ncbi:hypothetical protein A8990_10922 [Paenibacillus taihuensis]|uniref:Uncharacterized protein n=1 Tax=Paenibacillus taihuensis TaxID=1156355 RepID=A0A3D9SF39_9BACL|nr:hypothetical protein [Paenibacillus taihuensis]REE87377.1 hypothetical protein A8990_10922 [Paenibacillus taihuensis]
MVFPTTASRLYPDTVSIRASDALREQVLRQCTHWREAASRIGDLDNFAAAEAWQRLERYLGVSLRRSLLTAVEALMKDAERLDSRARRARTEEEFELVRQDVVTFRNRYMQTEMVLDFYGQAVNTRTNPKVAAILRACDTMARKSMEAILEPLGKPVPLVLTYIHSGLGASILKAGLRLWDGTTYSAVAAIKIVWHNLLRPTSLIHEAGHQIAGLTGWNEELALAFRQRLSLRSPEVADMWASWSSEIAADAIAFAHTGYAAVAGIHDVLAGNANFVYQNRLGDPHPISFLRVLMNVEMCRLYFGRGPWDDLALAWQRSYPIHQVSALERPLLEKSMKILPDIAEICLTMPMKAFGGRPLQALVNPGRVSPQALDALVKQAGSALFTSTHWVGTECLRLLALSGMRLSHDSAGMREVLREQDDWMIRLGMMAEPI